MSNMLAEVSMRSLQDRFNNTSPYIAIDLQNIDTSPESQAAKTAHRIILLLIY